MKKRTDDATGTETVGHEWDGIEELDTPLPRWWLMILYGTVVFAAGYVVAYPALPKDGGGGLLGWSSHGALDQQLAADTMRKAPILKALAATPVEDVPGNPKLLQAAVEGGRAAFRVNCVQCHGSGAAGGTGYPNLNDDDWLWGGDIKSIAFTITHGARSADDDESRQSQMPAFGEILKPAEIDSLVAHVRAISGQQPASAASAAGAQLFADNCAACHGADGKGNREVGAPNLTDKIWLYGGDAATLKQTITYARAGMMPRWNNRLDPVTIKMLAAYVHSLGGGEPNPIPVVAAAPSSAAPGA